MKTYVYRNRKKARNIEKEREREMERGEAIESEN